MCLNIYYTVYFKMSSNKCLCSLLESIMKADSFVLFLKEGSRLKVDYEVTWDSEGFFRNAQYEPAQTKLEERDAPVHGRKKHYTSRIESDHRKRFRVSYSVKSCAKSFQPWCGMPDCLRLHVPLQLKHSCMVSSKYIIRIWLINLLHYASNWMHAYEEY
jgi:hypothetical protein